LLCRRGAIGCTKDIVRPLRSTPVAVWWAPNAHLALEVVRQAQAEESTDVYSVARGLGVQLASHSDVIARAEAAVQRINDRLETAKANGLLRTFNRRYAELRQDARRRGQCFMPYNAAFGRLKRELYAAVAGVGNADLIGRALGATPTKGAANE
jgi:hypothetical protein